MRLFISLLFTIFLLPPYTSATVITADPTNFRSILSGLSAGDTLYLIPGNYTQSLRIENINGSSSMPILISGQPGLAKPVFLGNPCCNTVSLTLCSYLHLKDIICDGQNIAGIDAIKAEGSVNNWTYQIEIEGFEIYHYGADQQNVGISTKCPSWNWWVHHTVIDSAGTGMYFGNSNGEAPFVNSIIEYNLVMNTVGYNCQVKHQNDNTRDTMLGMPADGINVIRYNVFSKAQNASSGSSARPNLLVGSYPGSGLGSTDHYEIYGNLFYQNAYEGLFQGTGNIGFYNNLLFNNAGGRGLAIQTHNGFQPRDIDVFFNTVLIENATGISVSGVNSNYTQNVWANAVFASTTIQGGTQSQNITGSLLSASNHLKSPSLPLSSMDLTPLTIALQISGINLIALTKYENINLDFDGKFRQGVYAGAYAGDASPKWNLQLAIRDLVVQDFISANTQIFLDQSSISIYPCPVNDTFQIEGLIGNYDIDILNSSGSVFQSLSSNANPIHIDIQSLPSGIYFVSIFNKVNIQLHIQKIIKF